MEYCYINQPIYSHKFRNNDAVGFAQRPEAHLAPDFIDTGDILADSVDLLTPEVALVLGPLSLQAEYYRAFVDASAPGVGSRDFAGFYLLASYFLTGESRRYDTSRAAFGRVAPRSNFDMQGGRGAWELALRYSRMDLDDGSVSGGQLDDVTFGLNWYLNPNVRTMFNYVRSDLDGVGQTNIFETRFQVAF